MFANALVLTFDVRTFCTLHLRAYANKILLCYDMFYCTVYKCGGSLHPAGTWRLYNVGSTSMQRHDVASTLRRRCIKVMCPLGNFLLFFIF